MNSDKSGQNWNDNKGMNSPLFPIVAIGASAGGLNSIKCFLNALPGDFGFAIVFLQHLSHKHGNLLPGLLRSGSPALDIKEISDGMDVLSGKLYLCPPGMELRIEKGILHTAPLSVEHVHLPIDEFFISLAEDAGERAIAVIFSGAGTDGARGIQAVRNAGGTVFVQDPATAEFPGMPLAAIDTGKADGVLQPEEIAAEVLKLYGAVSIRPEGVITGEDFETFYRLILEKTGYRFNHYKKNVVNRRIRRRMYLRGVLSVQDYIKMVAEKDAEAGALAADLMIGVTSFFRDRLAWKALKLGVIRKLATEETGSPLRVWTPACATGEEAYSIAMMLHNEFELAGKKREIQVFATDVNDRTLDKAREGKYPGSIAADVPPDYMKRYFTCSEDGLSVIIGKEIRERVVVAKQDLLTDPPFSRIDLVICRNLLIYLEPQAQEKCIALFHYALKEGGYLFLGNAESVGRSGLLFRSLPHKKCRVYQKLETTPSSRLPLPVPFAPERTPPPSIRASVTEQQQSVTGSIQESLLEEYAPAAVAINQNYDIIYHNGPTNRYLNQPRGAPTQNLLELLSENLRSRVRGALYRATQEARPVSIRATIPGDDGRKIQVTLRISRLKENLSLIVFREKGGIPEQEAAAIEATAVDDNTIRQIESELSATRIDLQSHIEQLKSLNEELQSSNEELQAANEELETSREELQSLNEELITVNSQLQGKIEEQDETNNDLNNFLASTNIPTVFLDPRFRVKRFTPAMSKLLKLIPSDVGRPIADMSLEGLGPELIADAQTVLDNLVPVKKEILLKDVWYVRTALPYRTSDNRIEGVVITYSDVTDLKRAEEQTRHLASFPQLNPNPVIETDSAGKIIFYNPSAQKVLEDFGMDKGDANVFLPADFDAILQNPEKKEEATLYREITIKDRVFGATVQRVPQFNVARIYAFDITERKKAEKKLRDSKERLDRAQEIAHLGSWELDLISNNLSWSDEVYRIFGLQPQEFGATYEAFLEAVHPEDRAAVDAAYSGSIREGIDSYEIDHRVVRKDTGEVRVVHEKCEHIRGASGKIIRSLGMVHDITEIKRVEEALRESEERYRSIFDGANDGIIACDFTTGEFLFVNKRMSALTGYSEQELLTLGVKDIHPPKDLPYVLNEFNEMTAGKKTETRAMPVLRKDGDIIYCDISCSFLGKTILIGFFRDVTDRQKAEKDRERLLAELKKSNMELDSFSYTVSNDLRAPLRSIEGFTAAITEDYAASLDKTATDYFNRVIAASRRMSQLINAMLNMARLTRGELVERTVNLSELAEVAAYELDKKYPERRVEHVIAKGIKVHGDIDMLRVVIENLFDNAWKFTSGHEQAKIEFGVMHADGKDVYFVRDDGAGFDMVYADDLFTPFKRFHSETEFPGIGIGLAIVHKIIIKHGGKIWAESAPEKGATFYFTLG